MELDLIHVNKRDPWGDNKTWIKIWNSNIADCIKQITLSWHAGSVIHYGA